MFEEIVKVDIVFFVLDLSEFWGEIWRKFLVFFQVFRELKVFEKLIIVVFNKIDLIEEVDVEEKVRLIWEFVCERGISFEDVVKILVREGCFEEFMDVLNRVVFKLFKYGVFRIIVKEFEKVFVVMVFINFVGEVLLVEYGEKMRIDVYVQIGMVGEIKKMGVEIERLNYFGEGEEFEQDEGYFDGGQWCCYLFEDYIDDYFFVYFFIS